MIHNSGRRFLSALSKINNDPRSVSKICYGASIRGIRPSNEDRIVYSGGCKVGGNDAIIASIFDGYSRSSFAVMPKVFMNI